MPIQDVSAGLQAAVGQADTAWDAGSVAKEEVSKTIVALVEVAGTLMPADLATAKQNLVEAHRSFEEGQAAITRAVANVMTYQGKVNG